jgi:hypothetical protein
LAAAPLAALSFSPAAAHGWPVSGVADLVAGNEVFVRQKALAVQVDPPDVLSAEALASGELLLTPRKPGRALLLLLAEGGLDAVRVRVREVGGKVPAAPADEAGLAAARKECPGLKLKEGSRGPELEASVATGPCRRALLEVLQADDWIADRVDLTFHPEALQDQLSAMRDALARRGLGRELELVYTGATLCLKGRLDPRRRAETLGALFEVALGRLNFEDRTEGPAAAATSSAPAPGQASQDAMEREPAPREPRAGERRSLPSPSPLPGAGGR